MVKNEFDGANTDILAVSTFSPMTSGLAAQHPLPQFRPGFEFGGDFARSNQFNTNTPQGFDPQEVDPLDPSPSPAQTEQLGQPELSQKSERVPIPRASSVSQQRRSGPMSADVVLRERARPGRKPMTQDDTGDRRRKQNREAQRAFRDKRQQKLADTQQELEERKQEYVRLPPN